MNYVSFVEHTVLHCAVTTGALLREVRRNSHYHCGMLVCVFYTVCGYMVGILGLPALIHTAGLSQLSACLPPPQVSPNPCPAWLKRMERGNCCLPARLYSKHTFTDRSISIPTQLTVRPCYRTYLGPALPAEMGLLFLAWNHCMLSIKTSGLVCQDAMMHCCMLLWKVYIYIWNHKQYNVSMGCSCPQWHLYPTTPKIKARMKAEIIGQNWCNKLLKKVI